MRSITFIRTRLSKYSLYLSSRFFSASPPDPPDHPEVLLRKQPLLEHLRLSSLETCEAFKSAMRKVPQQVVVVTTGLYQPELRTWLKRGVTCSTFSSVSYHPPIISFCLNQGSRLHELIKTTGKFAVHVLAQDQVQQGIHFSKPALDSECQFFKVPHVQGEEGLPIILGSLAVFVCDSHSYHGVGDHTVWYGNVTGVSVSETLHDPLIYFVRKFRSVGDEIFITAFETATLPFENWTHEAHLRMAWNYITDHGKEKAVPYIKLGIQKYNEKNRDKIKTGYHETITMFFIHLVSDAIVSSVNANESFEEFLIRNQHLVNKDLLFEYYNKETLFQEDARNRFIEPDKKSLP
ncbi:flavin reductase (NADH) isoform X2 [Biomphalaria glabrata]|nr:flavin reductase (NADH) isoform X2 [Biomphalaria glabrata]